MIIFVIIASSTKIRSKINASSKKQILTHDQLTDNMVNQLENQNELFIIDNDGNINQYILEDDEKHPDAYIQHLIYTIEEEVAKMNKPVKINYEKIYNEKVRNVTMLINDLQENSICTILGCFSEFNDIVSHYYMINKGEESSLVKEAILQKFYKIRNLSDYNVNKKRTTYNKEITKIKKI